MILHDLELRIVYKSYDVCSMDPTSPSSSMVIYISSYVTPAYLPQFGCADTKATQVGDFRICICSYILLSESSLLTNSARIGFVA